MSPTVDDLRNSSFITKGDVDPPVLVTIGSVKKVNVAKEGAEPEMRWALNLNELDKPWIVNVTNGEIIAGITGSRDIGKWVGTQIVLYVDPNVSFGGKLIGGIRCRARKRQPAPEPVPEDDFDQFAADNPVEEDEAPL